MTNKTEPAVPTLLEWKELYEASDAFKQLKPWTWMSNDEIFGVQNPEDGQIGYCTIMGALGEVFALGLYLGTTGLEAIQRMLTEPMTYEEVMHIQKCLIASFENRDELDKNDLAPIRELGLKFRGRNAWPQFRNYEPGFYPWYLDSYQVRFLTVALLQAIDVAVRYRDHPDLLISPKKNHILVRVPEGKNGQLRWSDQWLAPVHEMRQHPKPIFADQLRLRRLLEASTRKLGTWEVDYFYAPFPVDGPDRPFYPRMCLWVDHESGMIVHFHLAQTEHFQKEFLDEFIGLMEEIGGMPHKLFVKNSEILNCFEATARALKIKAERVPILVNMEEAREDMFNHFG